MNSKNTNLRILSGKLKGKQLHSPHSELTHPMGAREKLALFNMLQPYLSGARVLDAYAGSGALGIEAVSLGASSAVFVERSHKIAAVLRENLQNTAITAEVFAEPVAKFVLRPEFQEYFDLIIADPPYDKFVVEEVFQLKKILASDGILALSFPAHSELPVFSSLKLLKSRQYAAAGIALYQKLSSNQNTSP